METYIALLRGINVSGHKIIKMELLRKAVAELNFSAISTYIQSGNIIFKSDEKNISTLESQIASKIEEHFGFIVPVIVVTPGYLHSVIAENPFKDREIQDPAQPYVAFLSARPEPPDIENLKILDFGNDEFAVKDRNVYLLYANSAANTKLSNAVLENKLRVRATSRNWKTIHKLIDLSTMA